MRTRCAVRLNQPRKKKAKCRSSAFRRVVFDRVYSSATYRSVCRLVCNISRSTHWPITYSNSPWWCDIEGRKLQPLPRSETDMHASFLQKSALVNGLAIGCPECVAWDQVLVSGVGHDSCSPAVRVSWHILGAATDLVSWCVSEDASVHVSKRTQKMRPTGERGAGRTLTS